MHKLSFPEHWEVMPLENVVNIFDKQRIPLNEAHRQQMQGGYPYCGANGVVDYVNDYIFDGEHILLAEDGGYWSSFENSTYLMNGKFWVNNHAHVLQAKQNLSHNYFLMCQLNYLDIKPFITGTTRGKLNQGMMKQVPLALPPLPEQRAIAHILQTIQESKFTRQSEIALERERKAALMDYLFSHGMRGEPRKQTEIGEIPESWEVVQLKEIANLRRENVKPADNQNLNFVGLEHIDSGESILKRWGNASAMKSAKNHFYPNDVLYGKLRAYLDKAVIAEMEGICSTDILVFTANSKTAPRFLVYLLHTQAFMNHAVATSTGISHPRTSWDSLGKFTFAFPPLSQQCVIANVFQVIDEKTAALEQEVQHLNELFHAMLDELMTGKRSAVPLIDTEVDV